MTTTVSFYDNFLQDLAQGRINLGSDTFKMMLVYGYTYNAGHEDVSDITGELATANGYTSGGQALSNTAISMTSGELKWDADDLTWTVLSSGDLGPVTGAVLYDDTITSPTADRLVCYIDFGTELTAGASTQFKIIFDSNGIFTIG